MKKLVMISSAAFALAACDMMLGSSDPAPQVEPLPLFAGYRSDDDLCQRVGENAYTNQFLDDMADLVACPVGYAGMDAFILATGAIPVDQAQGYVLFSIPRG